MKNANVYFCAANVSQHFRPTMKNNYYLATDNTMTEHCVNNHVIYPYQLVAVNEINDTLEKTMEMGAGLGMKWFIDSGIFNLTNEHMRKHGITMDEALSLAPEEIDGFDALFKKYVDIVSRWKERAWGYIELDQGGRENKIRTRKRLEDLGLKPIPVYHPFNDGWDYFDFLAENYDRICFGNVVQANRETRKKLLMTAYLRKQKYPNLWIHFLGLTPNEWLYACPIESCDSSTWLNVVRWNGLSPKIANQSFGRLHKDFQYILGETQEENKEYGKVVAMSAYAVALNNRNWQNHIERMGQL